MFGEIELPTYKVEAVLQDYLLRANLQPRGEILTYLNDKSWSCIPLHEVELFSLASNRRVAGIKQEVVTINKSSLCLLSVIKREQIDDFRFQVAKRAAVFYVSHFAIQGQIHISPDAPDEDLLDEAHDFYAVSEASFFAIRSVATKPTSPIPLAFVNRHQTQVYHVLKKAPQRVDES